MKAKTFVEILTEQIRDELRGEMFSDLQSAAQQDTVRAQIDSTLARAQQVELWLSLHVQPQFVAKAQGARSYGSPRPIPRSFQSTRSASTRVLTLPTRPKAERIGQIQTVEQILAADFFKREGIVLDSNFSESHLRSSFRKLALKLHPDRHAQTSLDVQTDYQARFARLTECTEILSAALAAPFNEASAAA